MDQHAGLFTVAVGLVRCQCENVLRILAALRLMRQHGRFLKTCCIDLVRDHAAEGRNLFFIHQIVFGALNRQAAVKFFNSASL